MYVAQYGFQTGIVRAFTAVPLHASCGVFMGVFYAYSKKAALVGKSPLPFTVLALVVPMMLHGVYDTFAFLGQKGTIPLLVLVVIMYGITIKTINEMSKADYRSGFYPAARSVEIDVDRF
jgi:RsiW-degrading membrane proteinase PrsW (M82 family)